MRDTQTRLVHCPSANLKLGSGIAKIAEYLEGGLSVALGADGAPCNNRMDAFTEMRTCALLHKVRSGPSAINAKTALHLATRGGAEALGLSDVGRIAPEYRADIVLLDLNRPHTFPSTGDIYSRLVYAAQPSDVRTVLVDGRVLVRDGELTGANLGRILSAADKAAQRVLDAQ